MGNLFGHLLPQAKPRTSLLTEQVLQVFSDHTRQHWEDEYSSYLYWKFRSVSAYSPDSYTGSLQSAYIDYKRDRGLSRCISDRNITDKEKAYIHNVICWNKGINPKQRRQPGRR